MTTTVSFVVPCRCGSREFMIRFGDKPEVRCRLGHFLPLVKKPRPAKTADPFDILAEQRA